MSPPGRRKQIGKGEQPQRSAGDVRKIAYTAIVLCNSLLFFLKNLMESLEAKYFVPVYVVPKVHWKRPHHVDLPEGRTDGDQPWSHSVAQL